MNFDSIIYEFDDEHKHENLVCNWRYDDYLSNNSITLITNQSNDIFNWQNCFLLRTYLNSIKTHSMLRNHWLTQQRMKQKKNEKKEKTERVDYFKTTILLNEKIDPTSSRHWFCANDSVFSIWVPYLNWNWFSHWISESRWWWTNFS